MKQALLFFFHSFYFVLPAYSQTRDSVYIQEIPPTKAWPFVNLVFVTVQDSDYEMIYFSISNVDNRCYVYQSEKYHYKFWEYLPNVDEILSKKYGILVSSKEFFALNKNNTRYSFISKDFCVVSNAEKMYLLRDLQKKGYLIKDKRRVPKHWTYFKPSEDILSTPKSFDH